MSRSRELSIESSILPKKKMTTEDIHLVRTDDEVQLLFEATLDFQAKKAYGGGNWESIKDNYKTIREISVSNLPTETGSEECAHSTDFFTGERIASKIKEIRAKYRKAFDARRQSGECRIVATFYDLYSEIWSRSPATESI